MDFYNGTRSNPVGTGVDVIAALPEDPTEDPPALESFAAATTPPPPTRTRHPPANPADASAHRFWPSGNATGVRGEDPEPRSLPMLRHPFACGGAEQGPQWSL